MNSSTQRGFIKLILIIVIGLVALGYFGYNVRDIFASPVVRDNLAYGWELAQKLWAGYLRTPALWLYENVLKILWTLAMSALTKGNN